MNERDYKNAGRPSRRKRNPPRRTVPVWVWVVAGVVIGGVLAFGGPVYRVLESTALTLKNVLQSPATREPPERSATVLDPPDETAPEFEFYNILPEMEVVIPPEELETVDARETSFLYRLQVGSFADPRDADALKARCTLLGFASEINLADVDGRTWYRVRVGPFERARDADLARRRLFDNAIDSIVLRETRTAPDG